MRLVVLTPQAVVVDREVVHVRAEDPSGAFGVLDHHADLLTALEVSVLVYRDAQGVEHFVAVRGGLFSVSGGRRIEVLTREAVMGNDLAVLKHDVVARFRKVFTDEERGRRDVGRLEGALVRKVAEHMRVERADVGTRQSRWPK